MTDTTNTKMSALALKELLRQARRKHEQANVDARAAMEDIWRFERELSGLFKHGDVARDTRTNRTVLVRGITAGAGVSVEPVERNVFLDITVHRISYKKNGESFIAAASELDHLYAQKPCTDCALTATVETIEGWRCLKCDVCGPKKCPSCGQVMK